MPKNDHKCSKNGHFWNLNFQVFFFQNWKTQFSNQIVIYVIAFDPINIQTCLAPQNDRQNLSFVKDSYVLAQKMTRNGRKLAKCKSCQFFKSPDFSFIWFNNYLVHRYIMYKLAYIDMTPDILWYSLFTREHGKKQEFARHR